MERKRRKRRERGGGLLVLALALFVAVLGLVVAPNDAWAAEGDVAQIGAETYATLDEAIEAASDGDTIELLADATTEGINLHKDLTIQASEGLDIKPTITFTQYGIAMAYADSTGRSLTFKDVDILMKDIGQTPAIGEWNWQSICVSKSTLTLDNVSMTMDGENAVGANNKTVHAIYFTGNSELNLMNGSVLTIQNYDEDALEWDAGNSSYKVNITDSTYISDNNRSGFTGTFNATIDNSTVKVLNSAGNGSNGTYYTITNGSDVTFDNSGTWGISAWRIDMSEDSTLVATNNGYSGVWTRVLNVDSSCMLDVEDNGYVGSFTGVAASTSAASNAGISFFGNGSIASVIEEGADVTITDNAGPGIATLQGVANLTIGSATITNNGMGDANGDHSAEYGGGLYNVGTVSLGDDVVLYNNHANTAGDDIYFAPTSTARTLTFGVVGSGWSLDGDPDCKHAIDGWYDDSVEVSETDEATGETVTVGGRWNAEIGGEPCSNDVNHYVKEYTEFGEDGRSTVTGGDLTDEETEELGTLALKAAHGEETVELKLAGVKTLDGRALAAGEFSFVLMDAVGAELQTVSNAADGSFSFEALSYDISAVGNTYTYAVSEVAPEDDDPDTAGVQSGNVTYDTDPVTVTVSVKLVDGELVCKASYEKAGVAVDSISFANTYQAEEPVTPGDDTAVDDGSGDDVTTDGGEATTSGEGIPKTGDPTSIAAVALAAAAGLGAIGAGAFVGRRRK